MVEGHAAAVGDDGCSGVYWPPARGFWKNVRTEGTKSVGGGLRRSCVVRCRDLSAGVVGAWGFRPRRKTGRWLVSSAVEWAVYGICTP
jgi:hypothetical protein